MDFTSSTQHSWARSWVISTHGQDALLDSGLPFADLEALAANPSASENAQLRLAYGGSLGPAVGPHHVKALLPHLRKNPGLDPSLTGRVGFSSLRSASVGEHLALGVLARAEAEELEALATSPALPESAVEALLALDPTCIQVHAVGSSGAKTMYQLRTWSRCIEAVLEDRLRYGDAAFEALVRRVPMRAFESYQVYWGPSHAVSWTQRSADPEVLSVLVQGFTGTLGELVDVSHDFAS
jgi:hypothetical protein